MSQATLSARDLASLRSRMAVSVPDDADWNTTRLAWNRVHDQQPLAVVFPEAAADVAAAIELARSRASGSPPRRPGTSPRRWRRSTRSSSSRRSACAASTSTPARAACASARACNGTRWRNPLPSTDSPASPGARPTSASSATRSAVGSAGSAAGTGSQRTVSWPRGRSSPRTAGFVRVDRRQRSRPLLGDPRRRWQLRDRDCPRVELCPVARVLRRRTSSTRSSAPPRCCTRGANGWRRCLTS